MIYCVSCLNTDTRPNTKFTADGLCPACDQFLKPDEIDWDFRKQELEEIVAFGKNNSNNGFDCIIGVSGGKDSTLQALYVKEVLKMNPLLVSLNYPPEQMSSIGARNVSNLISLGFDCVNVSCSPQTWKKLMKYAFYEFGNWAKATELALFSSVPKAAIANKIPLIWWGENASVMLGDLAVAGETPSDGNRLKYSNTLDGGNFDWIIESGLNQNQFLQFIYPSDEEMKRANLKIIFLAHFWEDFTPFTNANYSIMRGLYTKKPSRDNADFWGTSMLDEDFMILNMMIKWLKFGFGKASDNVNEEIRAGRISRKDGIRIVETFDGKCPQHIIYKFCKYLEISIEDFWLVVDKFVNKKLFEKISLGVYRPKFKVGAPYHEI
jgi:N-acetyl sugar amidotransferase